MAQDKSSLGKAAFELGVKLTSLRTDPEAKNRMTTESENLMDKRSIECFQISADEGDISGKVALARLTLYSNNPYKLSEVELTEIQKRGESPNATPEELRNLAICMSCRFIPDPDNKLLDNDGPLVNAAMLGDKLALHYYLNLNIFADVGWAAGQGSMQAVIALLSAVQNKATRIAPEDLEKFKLMLAVYKVERNELLSNASKEIEDMKLSHSQHVFKEIILCVNSTGAPTEVINEIENFRRNKAYNGTTPPENFIPSLTKFLASTHEKKPDIKNEQEHNMVQPKKTFG